MHLPPILWKFNFVYKLNLTHFSLSFFPNSHSARISLCVWPLVDFNLEIEKINARAAAAAYTARNVFYTHFVRLPNEISAIAFCKYIFCSFSHHMSCISCGCCFLYKMSFVAMQTRKCALWAYCNFACTWMCLQCNLLCRVFDFGIRSFSREK